eukprot:4418804-Lingulodinium_polyedra.AAC.1
MEDAAAEAFDYRSVPFPLAVALYMADAVGGLPPKMMWSMLMMMVTFVFHIDLAFAVNRRRPGQRVRPRLPAYPCAAPGGKKSPVKDTLLRDVFAERLLATMPWLLAPMQGGMVFPGGSTAMGCSQLHENGGYMAIVCDEACNFFPRNFATKGQVSQGEHFKPELLLAFRTGGAPERSLLKDKQKP